MTRAFGDVALNTGPFFDAHPSVTTCVSLLGLERTKIGRCGHASAGGNARRRPRLARLAAVVDPRRVTVRADADAVSARVARSSSSLARDSQTHSPNAYSSTFLPATARAADNATSRDVIPLARMRPSASLGTANCQNIAHDGTNATIGATRSEAATTTVTTPTMATPNVTWDVHSIARMTSEKVVEMDARDARDARGRAGDIARRCVRARVDGVGVRALVYADVDDDAIGRLDVESTGTSSSRARAIDRRARMSTRARCAVIAARARRESRPRRARAGGERYARPTRARALTVPAPFELDDDDDGVVRAMRDAARAAMDVAMSHRRRARVAETKRDATVATTADVAAQAACARRLRERAATSTTMFVGEETMAAVEDASVMRDVVRACAATIGDVSVEDVRSALASRAPPAGAPYFVCDPLDGTKAFVSGDENTQQFVFGLARVTPGVGLDAAVMIAPKWPGGGVELVAKKGAGCFARRLDEDGFRRLETPQPTSLDDDLSVVISAHETFEDLPLGKFGVRPTRVTRLCCGSLAKYVKVALGEAHVFVQHPKENDAFVNSWDHGAGVLCCEEAGARVTDALGDALRFEESEDKRRFAPGGGGVICAARSVHDDVVRAYARGLKVW